MATRPTCRFQAIGFSFGGLGAGNVVESTSWPVRQDIVVHAATGHMHFAPPTAPGWCEPIIVQAGFGMATQGATSLAGVLTDKAMFSRSYTGTNNRQESVVTDMVAEFDEPFFVGSSNNFVVGFTPASAAGPFAGSSVAFGFFNIAWNTLSEWNAWKDKR